jgi:hypothetical protein
MMMTQPPTQEERIEEIAFLLIYAASFYPDEENEENICRLFRRGEKDFGEVNAPNRSLVFRRTIERLEGLIKLMSHLAEMDPADQHAIFLRASKRLAETEERRSAFDDED